MVTADPELIRRLLEKVLGSGQLGKSETSRKLLTYLIERSLRQDAPKETEIAIDVFGRDASFNSAEDSLVRVGVRTLRQKLGEYYAGAGSQDELHFVIPKGGYRVVVETPAVPMAAAARAEGAAGRSPASAHVERAAVPGAASAHVERAPSAHDPAAGFDSEMPARSLPIESDARSSGIPHSVLWPRSSVPARRTGLTWALALSLTLLATSLLANLYLWNGSSVGARSETRVRQSPVWADLYTSPRTLTLVLGDLFMYTQVDPRTGRTLTVRDSEINSSEELRAFLASHPEFAAERGQRYTTLIPKSAAVGMAAILPIVARPGRHVEVRILDELQAEDIRNNDIIFVGPFVRLGPLAGHYLLRSRYRYDGNKLSLTDTVSQRAFMPEGALGNQRMDYGLAAKFRGPTGNHIMIFTSVGRNAGLLQIVRTLTSPEGLDAFEAKLRRAPEGMSASFEALLAVTGFKRTDLAADIIDVHTLSGSRPERRASTGAATATP